VRHALRVANNRLCAKKKTKGLTIFTRGDEEQQNKKLTRRENNGSRAGST
jgi:hypothetical protein